MLLTKLTMFLNLCISLEGSYYEARTLTRHGHGHVDTTNLESIGHRH